MNSSRDASSAKKIDRLETSAMIITQNGDNPIISLYNSNKILKPQITGVVSISENTSEERRRNAAEIKHPASIESIPNTGSPTMM